MIETIEILNKTIGEIRDAINSSDKGVLLSESSPLSDYASAIRQLEAQISSTNQQLVILYTCAANDEEANAKQIPAISWPETTVTEDGEKIGGDVVISVTDENGWVPTHPLKDITEDARLYIRFASIFYGESEINPDNLGIPILLEGKDGPRGDKGERGTDAVVIGLTQFRTLTLYNLQSNQPEVPEFKFDTEAFIANNGELSHYLYYTSNSTKKYVKESDSEWKFKIEPNTYAWEINVSFNSSSNKVEILSGPLYSIPSISETKIEYCLSASSTPSEEWTEERSTISNERPYLFCRVKTKYTTGYEFYSNPILLEEMPVVIIGIETVYGASVDVSIEPEEWFDIAPFGPVIWKKETTTYNRNVGVGSNVYTTVAPIAIQGAAGVQLLGKIDSTDDLPLSLAYSSDYVGKLGVIVGSDTYVWYGLEDPNLGCEKIGDYYWLNIGPLGAGDVDWNASEGDDGFIKNRTHYSKVEHRTMTIPSTGSVEYFSLPINATNIKIKDYVFDSPFMVDIYGSNECVYVESYSHIAVVFAAESLTEDLIVTYDEDEIVELDPKFYSGTYRVYYGELKRLITKKQLIPNARYTIWDYPKSYIVVQAIGIDSISKHAVLINKKSLQAFDIEYTLDNGVSAMYYLNGEPFAIDVYGYSDQEASELRADIHQLHRRINFVSGATYNLKDETKHIEIRRTSGNIPLSIGSWYPDADVTPLSVFINQTFLGVRDIIEKDHLLIYIGDKRWIDTSTNNVYGPNPHWFKYATECTSEQGTVLKYISYRGNEIPFDPNIYIDAGLGVNDTGRYSKILPYYDTESQRFLVAPIKCDANNAQVSIFDIQTSIPTDNENTRLS